MYLLDRCKDNLPGMNFNLTAGTNYSTPMAFQEWQTTTL